MGGAPLGCRLTMVTVQAQEGKRMSWFEVPKKKTYTTVIGACRKKKNSSPVRAGKKKYDLYARLVSVGKRRRGGLSNLLESTTRTCLFFFSFFSPLGVKEGVLN